ncbi:MAG: hypothetical protein H5T99_08155, partial [Moorella sp. (in: Bacteria)]|nr:hypothetical protein [Moorella sp. (in: firmicutes)]
RVLFLFNAVSGRQRRGAYSDCLTWETVRRVYRALMEGGNEIYPFNVHSAPRLEKLLGRIPAPHLAFVLAEGFLAEPRTLYDGTGAAAVRLLLQKYGIPASHSTIKSMEICRHKYLTYQVLQQHGLPVPPHLLIEPMEGRLEPQLNRAAAELGFPLFVKPNGGGNSMGISEASVVFDFNQLQGQVKMLLDTLGPLPVLVEKYLPGQEYTVGLIGRTPCYVLPPLGFLSGKIRTTTLKGEPVALEHIFPGDSRYEFLSDMATRVLAAVGGKDALRIDLRT